MEPDKASRQGVGPVPIHARDHGEGRKSDRDVAQASGEGEETRQLAQGKDDEEGEAHNPPELQHRQAAQVL